MWSAVKLSPAFHTYTELPFTYDLGFYRVTSERDSWHISLIGYCLYGPSSKVFTESQCCSFPAVPVWPVIKFTLQVDSLQQTVVKPIYLPTQSDCCIMLLTLFNCLGITFNFFFSYCKCLEKQFVLNLCHCRPTLKCLSSKVTCLSLGWHTTSCHVTALHTSQSFFPVW